MFIRVLENVICLESLIVQGEGSRMELRTGFKCDCCGVFVASYESVSFDYVNEDGSIHKTLRGHLKCIEYEHAKLKDLPINY